MEFQDFVGRTVIGLVVVLLYYGFVKKRLFERAPDLARFFKLTRRYSLSEGAAVMELVLAGTSHVAFCAVLMVAFGLPWKSLGLLPAEPILLGYGALLGVGTMAVSSLLGRIAISSIDFALPSKSPGDLHNWLALSRAGWMRHHLKILEVVPLPASLSVVFVQLFAEEIVFRGCLLHFFLPFGATTALLVSTALFVLMQVFHMPSLRSAMFPMLGALVVGLTHGCLYLAVPTLAPLIVANLVFFAVAII